MARTGQAEASNQVNSLTPVQQSAATGETGALSQFSSNEGKLAAGENVLANPWQSAAYLGNVNRLQSGALDAANNAGAQELRANNARTGGENTGATVGATRDLSLQKMRLADQLSAERAAQDQSKNVEYQQWGAQLPLQQANAYNNQFNTAVGGNSAAIGDLTQLGVASYGPWNSAISGSLTGAGTGAGLAACHLAAAVFGENFWYGERTNLVRNWLWNTWRHKHWYSKPVLWFYSTFGKWLAKSKLIVRLVRPLMERALANARGGN